MLKSQTNISSHTTRVFFLVLAVLCLAIVYLFVNPRNQDDAWNVLEEKGYSTGNSYYRAFDNYVVCTSENRILGWNPEPGSAWFGESLNIYDVENDSMLTLYSMNIPTIYWENNYAITKDYIIASFDYTDAAPPLFSVNEKVLSRKVIRSVFIDPSDYYSLADSNYYSIDQRGFDKVMSLNLKSLEKTIEVENVGKIFGLSISEFGLYLSNRSNLLFVPFDEPEKVFCMKIPKGDSIASSIEKEYGVLLAVLYDGRIMEYDLINRTRRELSTVYPFRGSLRTLETMKWTGQFLWFNDGDGNVIKVNLDTGGYECVIKQEDIIGSKDRYLENYVVNYCKSYIVIDVTEHCREKHYLQIYDYNGNFVRTKNL